MTGHRLVCVLEGGTYSKPQSEGTSPIKEKKKKQKGLSNLKCSNKWVGGAGGSNRCQQNNIYQQ